MILLRLLAALVGGLVLILPPILLAQDEQVGRPGWLVVGGLAWLGLMSLSFLFVAIFGTHMRRAGFTRAIGGLLLLIPAAASAAVLATDIDEAVLWASGILLSFTMLLFLTFVFPGQTTRRRRPMRERDHPEHVGHDGDIEYGGLARHAAPALVRVERQPVRRETRV